MKKSRASPIHHWICPFEQAAPAGSPSHHCSALIPLPPPARGCKTPFKRSTCQAGSPSALPLSRQGSRGEAVAQTYTRHPGKELIKVLWANRDQRAKQAHDRSGCKLGPGLSYTRLEPSYIKKKYLFKNSVSPGLQRSFQLRG